MIDHVVARLSSLDENAERLFHLRLPEIVGKAFGAQGPIESEIVLGELGRNRTRARAIFSRRSSPLRRLEHKTFYFDVVGHDVLPIPQALQRVL